MRRVLRRRLVSEIVESDDKKMESTEAASLGRLLQVSKLTATEALSCLERLERGSWLAKDDEGCYSLGVRTELQRRYTGVDMLSAEQASEPPIEAE